MIESIVHRPWKIIKKNYANFNKTWTYFILKANLRIHFSFLFFSFTDIYNKKKKNKLIYILDLVRMKNNRLFQVGEYSTLLYFYFTLYMKCLQKMSQKFLNSLSMALLFNVDNFENFQFLMCLYCLTHYISNIYYQREKSLFLLNKKKKWGSTFHSLSRSTNILDRDWILKHLNWMRKSFEKVQINVTLFLYWFVSA